MYLLMAVGLGITIWPGILAPGGNVSHMGSVVRSMLGALALVSLWGVRYPVKMLPMLELTRFRGHLTMLGGVHDGEETKGIFSGVSRADGAAGSIGANA
jgi:hypothetical protein